MLTPTILAAFHLPTPFWIAPAAAIVALVAAKLIANSVRTHPEGEPEMIRIAAAVREGAIAYLKRQYKVVAVVFVLLAGVLGVLSAMGLQPILSVVGVPLTGALSGICGWLGMKMATDASSRTAAAAKESLNDGLTVAFRSGAVMGLNVVGFALLDVSLWFILLTHHGELFGLDMTRGATLAELAAIMLSFGMGASTQALFARVGGGIYTKAADVGGDLVGKVEAGIPEDDPRNPATIADNVGDNVGDVAGMGADLYESYYGSILAAVALGTAAAFGITTIGEGTQLRVGLALAATPIALAGFGILASLLAIFLVRTRDDASFSDLLSSLRKGVFAAAGLITIAAFVIPWALCGDSVIAESGVSWLGLSIAILAGLFSGIVIAQWTEYCTSYEHKPTQNIVRQATTGPATVIIAGIAEGMKSTWAGLLAVVVAILVAFIAAGGHDNYLLGLYGVAIAAVGMLSTLGITLATDAYGPIADNAGGNAEMSGQPPFVRQRTDMLDSLGNTTAATGKGFAIGSAALTALALLAAYVQVVATQLDTQTRRDAAADHAEASSLLDKGESIAVYLGHGRFGLFASDAEGNLSTRGALLVDESQLGADSHFDDAVKRGQPFDIQSGDKPEPGHEGHNHGNADSKHSVTLEGNIPHGDHDHELSFRVVYTDRATLQDVLAYYDVTLTSPKVLSGLFVGVMLTFLFCALTMNAVGRAASAMMAECRRQFAAIRAALAASGMPADQITDPNNWPRSISHQGRDYPDYATCVSISTAGAQREMIVPSILAILVPLLVGLTLSVPGTIGLLAGGLTSGFAVAVFMANAGGAWDNAKKFIESCGKITANQALDNPSSLDAIPPAVRESIIAKATELRRQSRGETLVYGKGSDDHKAAVVGDTVGDPFKDTSGPSLNILIKLISIVAVVFAGLVVKFGPLLGDLIGL